MLAVEHWCLCAQSKSRPKPLLILGLGIIGHLGLNHTSRGVVFGVSSDATSNTFRPEFVARLNTIHLHRIRRAVVKEIPTVAYRSLGLTTSAGKRSRYLVRALESMFTRRFGVSLQLWSSARFRIRVPFSARGHCVKAHRSTLPNP